MEGATGYAMISVISASRMCAVVDAREKVPIST
jgi:hypothetical protein